jgi:predicted amidophosphoribosyltransferase
MTRIVLSPRKLPQTVLCNLQDKRDLLACPRCKSSIDLAAESYLCRDCGLVFLAA